MLSIIIPAYNEEIMIRKAYDALNALCSEEHIESEIIFIDDGSRDSTWEQIYNLSLTSSNLVGIRFSRNFGKESAIYAGLQYATGDCVAVIDCDLQHPPQKLVEMYRLWEQGYEVIEGVKIDRGQESVFHKLSSQLFYHLISKSTGFDMSRASDFKLLDRKAVDALLSMPERNAFFRALSSWVGFKTRQVEYAVQERVAGVSKWSTRSLINYAINNITSFTTAPMKIISFLGLIMLLCAVVFGVVAVCQKIAGVALGGFTTVILLLLFTGSIVMISLGVIGYYIAKIYEEVKARPRYIVTETI